MRSNESIKATSPYSIKKNTQGIALNRYNESEDKLNTFKLSKF